MKFLKFFETNKQLISELIAKFRAGEVIEWEGVPLDIQCYLQGYMDGIKGRIRDDSFCDGKRSWIMLYNAGFDVGFEEALALMRARVRLSID